jgi:mono/diheme cytochrome c family protein
MNRQRLTIAGGLVLIAALLAATPSYSGATEVSLRPTRLANLAVTFVQSPVEAAEKIYIEQCAPCHGTDGEGGHAPSLQTSSLSEGERVGIIRDGQAGMPAFGPTLSQEEIQAVSEFSGAFIGVGIYAEQCAPCHGVDGSGGVGPSLLEGVLVPSEIAEVIANGRSAMPAFAVTLTEEQLALITAYSVGLSSDTAAGEAIYATQCAPCHGDNLEGGVGPPLVATGQDLESQMAIVRDGRNAMPAFGPTLSDEQLAVLKSFLAGADPDATAPTSNGNVVYAEYCAGCHGTDREGGLGPALTGIDLSETEIADAVGNGQGTMQGFADTLSTEDLEAVVSFIMGSDGVREQEPGPDEDETPEVDLSVASVLYADNCRACHGAGGEGGAGPGLQDLNLSEDELTSIIADGKGSMPGFGGAFSDSEIEGLVALTATLAGSETAAPPEVDASTGLSLFLAHCSECHGDQGEGTTGPNLTDGEHSANEIVVDVWSGHENMPAFHEVLSPDEILAVSSYVADLPPVELATEPSAESGTDWPMMLGLAAAVLAAAGIGFYVFSRRRPTT